MEHHDEPMATNEDARRICGLREDGKSVNYLFEPWELGYSCPICSMPIINGNIVFDSEGNVKEMFDRLDWSEYRGFLFCKKCNIDIPSYFCLPRPISKESIKEHIKEYLHLIEKYQDRFKTDSDLSKLADIEKKKIELENENKRLFLN